MLGWFMEKYIEYIRYKENLYAIIIRDEYHGDGVHFLTDGDFSQQMAYMQHPSGKVIDAHVHHHEQRKVIQTQEVLVIKKGVLRVDFYTLEEKKYFGSILLRAGDVILLSYGGHGFEVIEDVEMVEVKQGPYLGDKDKERFQGVDKAAIHML